MTKDVTLKDLLQELADKRSFDFRGYKRTTLERRFRRRMFQLNIGAYSQYAEYIRKRPEEVTELLNTILINVTAFFRDPPAWEILRHEVLPSLLKRVKPGHSFRAWSAGCASGEEAYSIAILLAEHFGTRIHDYDIKIYANDIDDEALNSARHGEYSQDAIDRVRTEWREKYFQGKDRQRVIREIRRLVIFGRSNLAQDAPISHVNLLACRNVLIYFDSDLQKQILGRLHYALEPGGILFLGKSESQLTNSQHFQRVNARWRIFQRITNALVPDEHIETRPEEKEPVTQRRSLAAQELDGLRQQQQHLLETLRIGVLVMAANDIITQHNSSALALCGLPAANLAGRRLQETDLFIRLPELGPHLQAARVSNELSHFPARIKMGADEKSIEV